MKRFLCLLTAMVMLFSCAFADITTPADLEDEHIHTVPVEEKTEEDAPVEEELLVTEEPAPVDEAAPAEEEVPETPAEEEVPETPADEEVPETPADEAAPETPADEAEVPVTPADEEEVPVTPAEEEVPVTPADEEVPETPADEAAPETPADEAEVPETPADEEVPETPADEAAPETPADEEVPETPADEAAPETPADEEVPETPADEAAPETPADEAAPETPADEAEVPEIPVEEVIESEVCAEEAAEPEIPVEDADDLFTARDCDHTGLQGICETCGVCMHVFFCNELLEDEYANCYLCGKVRCSAEQVRQMVNNGAAYIKHSVTGDNQSVCLYCQSPITDDMLYVQLIPCEQHQAYCEDFTTCFVCGQTGLSSDDNAYINHDHKNYYQSKDNPEKCEYRCFCGEVIFDSNDHTVIHGESTCSDCGAAVDPSWDTFPGHTYGEYRTVVNTDGTEEDVRVCTVCRSQETRDHHFEYTYTSSEHTGRCANCGKVINGGHQVLCSSTTCSVCWCSQAQGDTLHSSNAEYSSDENEHWRMCDGCAEVQVDKGSHTFDPNNGLCTVCNYKDTTPCVTHRVSCKDPQVCTYCEQSVEDDNYIIVHDNPYGYCESCGYCLHIFNCWAISQEQNKISTFGCYSCNGYRFTRSQALELLNTGEAVLQHCVAYNDESVCIYCNTAITDGMLYNHTSNPEYCSHWVYCDDPTTCQACGAADLSPEQVVVRHDNYLYYQSTTDPALCVYRCFCGEQVEYHCAHYVIHGESTCSNCGASIDPSWDVVTRHTYGDWQTVVQDDGTEQDIHYCTECQEGESSEHYVGQYGYTPSGHTGYCEYCGKEFSGPHTVRCNTTTCPICWCYAAQGDTLHYSQAEFTSDENEHWRMCDGCGEVKVDKGSHTFDPHTGYCQVCNVKDPNPCVTHRVSCTDITVCTYCGESVEGKDYIVMHDTEYGVCSTCGNCIHVFECEELQKGSYVRCYECMQISCSVQKALQLVSSGNAYILHTVLKEDRSVCIYCQSDITEDMLYWIKTEPNQDTCDHAVYCSAPGTCYRCGKTGLTEDQITRLWHDGYTCSPCTYDDVENGGHYYHCACGEQSYQPLCHTIGHDGSACTKCGAEVQSEWEHDLSHSWGEWQYDNDDRDITYCTYDGCEAIKTTTHSALDDAYGYDSENHWFICEQCGQSFTREHKVYCDDNQCNLCTCLNPQATIAHYNWSMNPVYSKNASHDWLMCEGCGEAKVDVAAHDFDAKGYCAACGYQRTSITLTKASYIVGMGEKTVKIGYKLSGAPGTVTFTSLTTSIVKVNASTGVLTPVAVGTGKVRLSVNGVTKDVTIYVRKPTVKLNATSVTMAKGMTRTLTATLSQRTDGANAVTWKSSSTCVTVVNGKLTAKATGTAVITVTTAGGNKATCKVTVVDPVPSLKVGTKIQKNGATITLKKGKTLTLGVYLKPSATVTQTWTTSNKAIATVSTKGVVKGIKAGTVTITLKLPSGRKAYVKVKVQ